MGLTNLSNQGNVSVVKENSFPLSTQASILIGSVIISVSILISGGIIKLQGSPTPTATATVPQGNHQTGGTVAQANVTAGNLPTLGNKDAKVLVVEWADFQCPFCRRFFDEVEPQIKKNYIDTGKIRFAFRDFAFLGTESNDAANAARCAADQNKFWEFHDYLYSHQGQENSGTFSKDNLKQFGAALGLNTGKFNSCIDNDTHAKEVSDDVAAGRSAGVSGTPTSFVNGTQLVGAQPYSAFKAAIDSVLAGK